MICYFFFIWVLFFLSLMFIYILICSEKLWILADFYWFQLIFFYFFLVEQTLFSFWVSNSRIVYSVFRFYYYIERDNQLIMQKYILTESCLKNDEKSIFLIVRWSMKTKKKKLNDIHHFPTIFFVFVDILSSNSMNFVYQNKIYSECFFSVFTNELIN